MHVKVRAARREGRSALTRVRATRRLSIAMATTVTPSMTDDSILTTYQRDGYAIRRGLVPAADLDPVRAFLAAEVDAYARRMLAEGEIRSLHAEQPFERRFAAICREMDVSPRSWIGSVFDRVFYDLYRHPAILRVLGESAGPGGRAARRAEHPHQAAGGGGHLLPLAPGQPLLQRAVPRKADRLHRRGAHRHGLGAAGGRERGERLRVGASRQPPLGPDRRGARRGPERARHRGRRAARHPDPGGDAGG